MTLQENEPVEIVAWAPLQLTDETPERASVIVPLTAICAVLRTLPSAGEEMLVVGAVLSKLTVAVAVAVCPAVSVAVPVIC